MIFRPLIWTLSLFGVFSLSACSFYRDKEVSGKQSPTLKSAEVWFAQIKAQIFERYCVRCHDAGSSLNLNVYSEAKAAISKIQNRVLVMGDMPMEGYPQLSPDELTLLATWIENGAPEAATGKKPDAETPPPPPEPSCVPPSGLPPEEKITYEVVKTKILDPHCFLCHGADSGLGDFSTYERITAASRGWIIPGKPEKSELLGRLKHTNPDLDIMPPFGALPAEEIATVQAWIEQCALP